MLPEIERKQKITESYNLWEYQQQVVLKTLLVKDNHLFNVSHMVLGMGSELMSELPVADKLNNEINRIEELGDIEFFAAGYAYFEGIELPNKITITAIHSMCDPIELMNYAVGSLQTIVKKELVSGVKKLDGVIVTKEKLTEIVYLIFSAIQMYANYWDLDLETVVRPANARKLNVRYEGGGFTAENSIDRDYQAEDAALKGTDPITGKQLYPHELKEVQKENLRITDFEYGKISQDAFDRTANLTPDQYIAFFKHYQEIGGIECMMSPKDIINIVETVTAKQCTCGPKEGCVNCPKDTPIADTFKWSEIRDTLPVYYTREKDYEDQYISPFVFGYVYHFTELQYQLFRLLYTSILAKNQELNIDVDIDMAQIHNLMTEQDWCINYVDGNYSYDILLRIARIYFNFDQERFNNFLFALQWDEQSLTMRTHTLYKCIYNIPTIEYHLNRFTDKNLVLIDNDSRRDDLISGKIDTKVGEITDVLNKQQYLKFKNICSIKGGIDKLQYEEMEEIIVDIQYNPEYDYLHFDTIKESNEDSEKIDKEQIGTIRVQEFVQSGTDKNVRFTEYDSDSDKVMSVGVIDKEDSVLIKVADLSTHKTGLEKKSEETSDKQDALCTCSPGELCSNCCENE